MARAPVSSSSEEEAAVVRFFGPMQIGAKE
jgi:hypothetical protein